MRSAPPSGTRREFGIAMAEQQGLRCQPEGLSKPKKPRCQSASKIDPRIAASRNVTESPSLLTIRGRPIRAASRLSTLKWARGPLNIRGNAAIATFFAPVLAVPPSPRTWDLANARGLIATHQRARIARGTLSVASAVAAARRLRPST